MAADVDVDADDGVVIGYKPERRVAADLELGTGARLRKGTILYHGTRIGARLQTGHNVVIREQCTLGDDVSVWSNTVIDYGCVLGNGVKVHTNCYVAQYSVLEDHAFLAPGVTFANDLYPGDETSAQLMRGPTVGAGAQLGVNVTVLPYVTIGAGSIIGAGSVVTRDIPEGVVAYGNPAVVVKDVSTLRPIRDRVGTRSVE